MKTSHATMFALLLVSGGGACDLAPDPLDGERGFESFDEDHALAEEAEEEEFVLILAGEPGAGDEGEPATNLSLEPATGQEASASGPAALEGKWSLKCVQTADARRGKLTMKFDGLGGLTGLMEYGTAFALPLEGELADDAVTAATTNDACVLAGIVDLAAGSGQGSLSCFSSCNGVWSLAH